MEPEEISDQLTISPEQAFYIIVKAREFDEQVEPTDPDSGSNPADDRKVDVLEEEEADDTVGQELEAALEVLNVDEQLDLLALTWLGRGEYASFAEAREEASDMRDKHIPDYLIGTPSSTIIWKKGSPNSGFRLRISSAIACSSRRRGNRGRVRDRGLRLVKAGCWRRAGQAPQEEQEARSRSSRWSTPEGRSEAWQRLHRGPLHKLVRRFPWLEPWLENRARR